MKRYRIQICNLDTFTEIERDLTQEQFDFLRGMEEDFDSEGEMDPLASWMEIHEIS